MQEQTATLPDGKEIKYKDCIHHHVTTTCSFMDRIRILFRGKFITSSEIYTAEVCNVKGSTGRIYVEPIFKKKPKYVGMMHSPVDQKAI